MQTMVPLYGFGGVPYSAVRKAAPHNLLDNSDFRNPVNQRGASNYTGNFVRGIDRWIAAEPNGSVTETITDNGITFSASSGGLVYLIQRFEKGYLDISKPHTIAACLADGTVIIVGYIDTSDENVDAVNVTFPSGSTVQWVVLYEGEYTTETLPEYHPKGYGAELAECQRYYLPNCGRYANGMAYARQNVALVQIPTPVKMRGAQISVKVVDAIVTSDAVYAITGIEGVEVTANGVIARASVSGGPFSRDLQCTTANTNIDIIADL